MMDNKQYGNMGSQNPEKVHLYWIVNVFYR